MAIVTKRRTFAVCVAMAATLLSSCSARRAPTADRCNPAEGAALTPARVSFAPPLPADPTASPSSALRSGLQLLLREQVDVLVYVTAAHLSPGSHSSRARGAAAVLDENATALGFALGGCHLDTRSALRAAWSKRAELLWQYGKNMRQGKAVTGIDRSLTKLDDRLSLLLTRRLGTDKSLIQRQLETENVSVQQALGSIGIAGDSSWLRTAQQAGDATDQTALSWAEALARKEHLPGSPDDGPASTRAELTSLLARPVGSLVWAAQASTGRPRSPDALGRGATVLADTSRQVWSADGGDATRWQQMDQGLVDVASAFIDHRPVREIEDLLRALTVTQEQLAVSFSKAHPGTSAAAVAATLEGPTHAMLVAVRDAVAHRSPAAWDIAASEDGFAGLAAVLAKALTGVNAGVSGG